MNTIIVLILVWTASTLIMMGQIFEKDIPVRVSFLRLVLSPIILIFSLLSRIMIEIRIKKLFKRC